MINVRDKCTNIVKNIDGVTSFVKSTNGEPALIETYEKGLNYLTQQIIQNVVCILVGDGVNHITYSIDYNYFTQSSAIFGRKNSKNDHGILLNIDIPKLR